MKAYFGVLKARIVARDILERRFMMEDIETIYQLVEVLRNCPDRGVLGYQSRDTER
jgi:hypothetical protein